MISSTRQESAGGGKYQTHASMQMVPEAGYRSAAVYTETQRAHKQKNSPAKKILFGASGQET